MTELRLHRDLYTAAAVEGAVKALGRFGAFEVAELGAYHLVRITASSPAREAKLSRELGNYALGLTRQGPLS
ncbi:MAG: HxsD-like protein [Polyangiales bacterium]